MSHDNDGCFEYILIAVLIVICLFVGMVLLADGITHTPTAKELQATIQAMQTLIPR